MEFGHIASAPGGVHRLRQMIYNLAITGDLTQRSADDENAESLLREIKSAKARLIDKKIFKRSPRLENQPLVAPISIRLPDSWCWSRLVDIGEISPKNKEADDTVSSFIPMSGIPQLHSGKLKAELRPWGQIKKGFTHFANGDVVLAKITPCFENGKAAVVAGLMNGIGAGTTELHVVRPLLEFIVPAYVYIFLRSPYFAEHGRNIMTGTAGQKRLPTEYFANRAFPLPPIAEQKRIVAKVDELMSLCDKLEAQHQERVLLHQHASTAVIDALTNARTVEDLTRAWRRLEAVTSILIVETSDVDNLRRLILDMAATGRLSEAHTDDGSAEDLIEEARMSKIRRIGSGEIKKKRISPTNLRDLDILKPSHWVNASMEDLFRFIDYRGKTPTKTTSGRVLITAKNVRPGRIEANPQEYISETSYQTWMTRGWPQIGDLLITTEAPLGNVARLDEEPEFALAQRVINLQPYARLNTQFFMYFMMSPSFQNLLRINATGTTAKGIKAAKLRQLKVSVPPFEEQERIVQRTRHLLSLCDELERQISKAQSLARQLASSTTTAITGIRIEDKEKMKAPKTELVSNLRIGASPANEEHAPLATILVRHQGELSARALWGSSGMDIDGFYQQLKTEMASGWIVQPELAYMKELGTA